ncbi:MAG: F0F1 ATP synthase subunit epsilon [Acidobacteriaceae bacterium]
MTLKLLLPTGVFVDTTEVSRIVAETREGSFELLPHRLDCVAALAPGIFTYDSVASGTVYLAVDAGVLVKAGAEVLVSVRRAIAGPDLGHLHEAVKQQFLKHNSEDATVSTALNKMESGFVSRLLELQHER